VSSWRTDATTAALMASSSSDRPAAERPTRPLPRRLVCRAMAAARPTEQRGNKSLDLAGHTGREFDVLGGPTLPVPTPAAHPGLFVGQALLLRLLQGGLLNQQALALVPLACPAPPDDHGRQAAGLLGPAGQRRGPGREEHQVTQVGAGQAQRARLVHDQQIPGALALRAGPVLDGLYDQQIRCRVLGLRDAFPFPAGSLPDRQHARAASHRRCRPEASRGPGTRRRA
jgi:hypothetical protein